MLDDINVYAIVVEYLRLTSKCIPKKSSFNQKKMEGKGDSNLLKIVDDVDYKYCGNYNPFLFIIQG